MTRPSPNQLIRENYPYILDVPPRYADLDPLGHINNVAIASIFETARIGFHRQLSAHPRELGVRWLVAAINMNFLEEMHFPAPIVIASGLAAVGNSSWTILSAAFQSGECCASCETVMVAHGPEGRRYITDDLRARMEPFFVRGMAPATA